MKVGNKYYIKTRLPFQQVTSGKYLLVSSKLIPEYISEGLKPLNFIYLPVGLTKKHMDSDAENKVPILTFVTSKGNSIEIPANMVEEVSRNSIDYSIFGIGIKIPPLPTNTNFDNVLIEVKHLIYSQLGLQPTVSLGRLSLEEMVNVEKHEELERKRLFNKSKKTDKERIKELELQLNDALISFEKLKECVIASEG